MLSEEMSFLAAVNLYLTLLAIFFQVSKDEQTPLKLADWLAKVGGRLVIGGRCPAARSPQKFIYCGHLCGALISSS